MAELLPVLKQRFYDSSGAPLAGGKLYSYISGTSTPAATFADQSGGTPNANPIILDSNGAADVWIGGGYYKFVLANSLDVVQWTVDGVSENPQAISAWSTNNVTDGQAATNVPGETVDFSKYSSAIYEYEIIRGTATFANGSFTIQNVNGTGRLITGNYMANEDHGVTFSITQTLLIAQLQAALSVGPGNGTIKLSRRLLPV